MLYLGMVMADNRNLILKKLLIIGVLMCCLNFALLFRFISKMKDHNKHN